MVHLVAVVLCLHNSETWLSRAKHPCSADGSVVVRQQQQQHRSYMVGPN